MASVLHLDGYIGLNNGEDMDSDNADEAMDAIIEALESRAMHIFAISTLIDEEEDDADVR